MSKLGDGHIFDTICSHTNPCFCVAVKAAQVFNDITESFITTYKTLRIIQKKTHALRHFIPGDTDCSLIMTEERVVNDCHTTTAKCNNAPIDLIKPHSAAVPLCVSVVQLMEARTLSVTTTRTRPIPAMRSFRQKVTLHAEFQRAHTCQKKTLIMDRMAEISLHVVPEISRQPKYRSNLDPAVNWSNESITVPLMIKGKPSCTRGNISFFILMATLLVECGRGFGRNEYMDGVIYWKTSLVCIGSKQRFMSVQPNSLLNLWIDGFRLTANLHLKDQWFSGLYLVGYVLKDYCSHCSKIRIDHDLIDYSAKFRILLVRIIWMVLVTGRDCPHMVTIIWILVVK